MPARQNFLNKYSQVTKHNHTRNQSTQRKRINRQLPSSNNSRHVPIDLQCRSRSISIARACKDGTLEISVTLLYSYRGFLKSAVLVAILRAPDAFRASRLVNMRGHSLTVYADVGRFDIIL